MYTNAEFQILNVLWERSCLPAKELYKIVEKDIGWHKNTTYSILKKCIQKGFIERKEPNFICIPILTKEKALQHKIQSLIQKLFQNSNIEFAKVLLKESELSAAEKQEIIIIWESKFPNPNNMP